MNVIIRTDASYTIGSGHVMRCLTLAEAWRKKGANILFFCRCDGGNMIQYIESFGFIVKELAVHSWEDEIALLQTFLKQNQIDWLVVDHYELDIQFEKALRPLVHHVLIIDDLANRMHDCDILLDQNYLQEMCHRYDGLLPMGAMVCSGPSYVLLRPAFYQLKPRKRNGKLKRLLIFFGGSDPTNETEKVIRTLVNMDEFRYGEFEVDIVVGNNNQKRYHIANFCSIFPYMHYYEQITNMEMLMQQADLMIGSGGTTTWERCYMGLPAITITVADNQYAVNEAVHGAGAHYHLGWYCDVEESDIQEKVMELSKNPQIVVDMSRCCFDIMKNHEREKILAVMEGVHEGKRDTSGN